MSEQLRTILDSNRLSSLRLLALCSPEGCAAEVGVYQGGSLMVIAKSLKGRKVFGCDTFCGLPKEHFSSLEIHKPGEFSDTSLESVSDYLSDCENVVIVPGVFPDSATLEMRNAQFSFVHIDTDYYLAVSKSIAFFWPRLVQSGIMVFDDYGWHRCPGVQKAIEEHGLYVERSAEIQAFAIKR